MKKQIAPVSQKESAHIQRLSLATKREEHRLKTEQAKFVPVEIVNDVFEKARSDLTARLGRMTALIARKIEYKESHSVSKIARAALDDTLLKFSEAHRYKGELV
jgi:hypothetical protein